MRINGKVIAVTGGGNGIGREVVLSLLRKGARVVALDLSDVGLKETAELAQAGDRLDTRVLDITDREEVLALPEQIEFGPVDGLVNVAGIIQDFKPVSELDFATIERVMRVNYWGTVNTVKAFLPVLESRPEAVLVNVSSMGALVPFPGQTAYGASKAAVKLFTEGLIAEYEGTNLAVTVVFPGAVATHIASNSGVESPRMASADTAKAMASATAPEEAARLIVEAIETGKPRVLIGGDARMLDRMGRLIPARAIGMIAKKMKKMLG